MVNDPLTQYMFCSPNEGAAAVVLCRAEIAHRFTAAPIYLKASVGAHAASRGLRGAQPVVPPERADSPTVDASRAAYEIAGLGPEDVDVVQLQDTDAGAEVIHMAENGFCKDGETGGAAVGRRHRDRGQPSRSTPTAASSPTENLSEPPASARSTNWCSSSGEPPATGRSPGLLGSATASSTERPGLPAWPSCRPNVQRLSTAGNPASQERRCSEADRSRPAAGWRRWATKSGCPRGVAVPRCGGRAGAFIARRGRGRRRSMHSCDTSRPSALPALHPLLGWMMPAGRSSASSRARCWRTQRGNRATRRRGRGGRSPTTVS